MKSEDVTPGIFFSLGAYAGRISEKYKSDDLLADLRNIAGKVRSGSSLGPGTARNRNVIARLLLGKVESGSPESLQVVIKSFAPQPLIKDLIDRKRGSKAFKTWQAATALLEGGVSTPEPVCYVERREGNRLTESYYVVKYDPEIVSFKSELIRLFREEPECGEFMALLETVARGIQGMHKTGFLHNDLGNQNIYLRGAGREKWGEPLFVDLNRGRLKPVLSLRERARDISRIWLPSDLLRVFKEMYFDGELPPIAFQKWETIFRNLYAAHANTRKIRHPVRHLRASKDATPPQQKYPRPKEMWVWDSRSVQPISLMRRKDRKKHYLPGRNLRIAASTAGAAVPVLKEYHGLLEGCYTLPVQMSKRTGVALGLAPGRAEAEIELLRELGDPPVFVRLYRHEHSEVSHFKRRWIKQLHSLGLDVSIALVQDRESVIDPRLWEDFVYSSIDDISDHVGYIEVGHAINRVKWGIWEPGEYIRMLEVIADIARQRPEVRFTGPAVIDFEYPYLISALKRMPGSFSFHGLSHHLYVDRRGAPENRQGPFSLLEKCVLARAVARWSRTCGDRLIISETNWPLSGTGVYSPVGAPYESPGPRFNDPSVDEDTYADFMIRYLLIALCSGMAERAYWWRLVAYGFGLVDDRSEEQWRKRPAFGMLQHFIKMTEGSVFSRKLTPVPGVHFFVFKKNDGSQWCAAYSTNGEIFVDPPFSFELVTNAFGIPIKENAETCKLCSRPVYMWLS